MSEFIIQLPRDEDTVFDTVLIDNTLYIKIAYPDSSKIKIDPYPWGTDLNMFIPRPISPGSNFTSPVLISPQVSSVNMRTGLPMSSQQINSQTINSQRIVVPPYSSVRSSPSLSPISTSTVRTSPINDYQNYQVLGVRSSPPRVSIQSQSPPRASIQSQSPLRSPIQSQSPLRTPMIPMTPISPRLTGSSVLNLTQNLPVVDCLNNSLYLELDGNVNMFNVSTYDWNSYLSRYGTVLSVDIKPKNNKYLIIVTYTDRNSVERAFDELDQLNIGEVIINAFK